MHSFNVITSVNCISYIPTTLVYYKNVSGLI